jgi:hypothetical protein
MVVGFTLVEGLIVVLILLVLFGGYLTFFTDLFSGKGPAGSITGAWSTSPATVSTSAGGTFVWTMTGTVGGASKGIPGRATTISVMPQAGVRIVSVTDGSGTTPYSPPVTTATAATDVSGQISVDVQIDFLSGASISAVDTGLARGETATFRGVQ